MADSPTLQNTPLGAACLVALFSTIASLYFFPARLVTLAASVLVPIAIAYVLRVAPWPLTEAAPGKEVTAVAASFASSNYRRLLAGTPKSPSKPEIKAALRKLLRAYEADSGAVEADGEVQDVDKLLSEASYVRSVRFRKIAVVYSALTRSPTQKAMWAALRLWTSGAQIRTSAGRMELCSLVNHALREDRPDVLPHVLVLTRALTLFCNVQLEGGFYTKHRRGAWPDGFHSDEADVTFRGGGLPSRYRAFFTVGRRFRYAGFVASSFRRDMALEFMRRQGEPKVLWTLRFDPVRRCAHVNLIRALDGAQFQEESEFLLSPYSAFEVVEVAPRTRGTNADPHRITLRVAADNRDPRWPEDLALSPWL